MAFIEVKVSSSQPVKFHCSAEGPAWKDVIAGLASLHGPGVLQDAEGVQLLVNKHTQDVAPAGTYTWLKAAGRLLTACKLFLPDLPFAFMPGALAG